MSFRYTLHTRFIDLKTLIGDTMEMPLHMERALMDYFLNTRFWNNLWHIAESHCVVWIPYDNVRRMAMWLQHSDVEMYQQTLTCPRGPCAWDGHQLECKARVQPDALWRPLCYRHATTRSRDTLDMQILDSLAFGDSLVWFWSRVPKQVWVCGEWQVYPSLDHFGEELWTFMHREYADHPDVSCYHLKINDECMTFDVDAPRPQSLIQEAIHRHCHASFECQFGVSTTHSDKIHYTRRFSVELLPILHPPPPL